MNDRIYVSSGAFQARTLPKVLKACQRLEVEGLELSSGLVASDAQGVDEIAEQCAAVPRLLVHNYFPPPEDPFTLNLASPNDETLRRSMEMARTAIDLCRLLEAPFYSVHAGFALDLPPSSLGRPESQAALADGRALERPAALERFRSAVVELATYAAGHGVGLLLENNVVTRENITAGEHPFLLADPAEMKAFFHDLSAPNVGLLLDVGHLRVSSTALGFDPQEGLAEIRHHIEAFHVSWNDGHRDTNDPVPDQAWFLKPLVEVSCSAVVLEVYNLSERDLRHQIALLERTLESAVPPPR